MSRLMRGTLFNSPNLLARTALLVDGRGDWVWGGQDTAGRRDCSLHTKCVSQVDAVSLKNLKKRVPGADLETGNRGCGGGRMMPTLLKGGLEGA